MDARSGIFAWWFLFVIVFFDKNPMRWKKKRLSFLFFFLFFQCGLGFDGRITSSSSIDADAAGRAWKRPPTKRFTKKMKKKEEDKSGGIAKGLPLIRTDGAGSDWNETAGPPFGPNRARLLWRSDRPLHGNSSIKPYLRRPQRPSTFQPTPLPLPIAIVMAFNGRRANVLPFSRELIGCHWRSAKATRSLFSSFFFF